jgi:CDP-6-deoxy-D-xylo-4-hexulose-3-dehydrase
MKFKQPQFPLAYDTIDKEDIDALCTWLQKGERLSKGDLTIEFEKKWAQYIGTTYSIFCNSGSSANYLMALALLYSGKLKNKKIIVPSVGWVTTISSFMLLGFEPIMCGANSENFGLDLDELEKLCIEHNPGTVIFVDVLGFPNDIYKLRELRDKYNFYLLEDSCAALGSKYNSYFGRDLNNKVGSLSDMSSFSFYFGHQLSTIEGGMVNTNDEDLYHLLLMLRSHGWGKDLPKEKYKELIEKYDIDDFHSPFTFFVPGMNLRSTDLQAFLGLRQIEKAEWVAEQRNKNHKLYYDLLHRDFFMQKYTDNMFVSSISVGVLANNVNHRKRIVEKLVENDIETRVFSAGNLGRQPFWRKRYGDNLDKEFRDIMSDRIHDTGLFLPNTPTMTEEDIKFICNLIKNS